MDDEPAPVRPHGAVGRATSAPATLLRGRFLRVLRWRFWIQEKLQPSEWQVTLWWAAVAGCLGALASLVFTTLTERVHDWFGGTGLGVVDSMARLPWWACLLVPTAGGALAGVILVFGPRLTRSQSSTDYMEAIAIGSGRLPVRASLIKSAAALFSIGSGGSIGREGPMVQLAAVVASQLGRGRKFTPPKLRLLVACGAAAGIASAYNAPIAGSFFVAEIILGTIAMESLGPLAVSAVAATLTIHVLTATRVLYQVPAFGEVSPLEMGPYLALGVLMGGLAPVFLVSLKNAERFFLSLRLPLVARLALGGLAVGVIAINVPQVCGNGYSVVVEMLQGRFLATTVVGYVACKWLATMASFGSGAPGGVFTPALFMGAGSGLLFGMGVHALWPAAAPNPIAFALVGMGAFLAAASHAPLMAVIMLFEMTLSYDIVLPLLLCNVIAYYTARGVGGASLYAEALKRKVAAAGPAALPAETTVADLMRPRPRTVEPGASFSEVAQTLLQLRTNHLYVADASGRFLGAVSLEDIKPYLQDPGLASVVVARDIVHEDFPQVTPDQSFTDALARFLTVTAERLPVVDSAGTLLGCLARSDVLLRLSERRKSHAA